MKTLFDCIEKYCFKEDFSKLWIVVVETNFKFSQTDIQFLLFFICFRRTNLLTI